MARSGNTLNLLLMQTVAVVVELVVMVLEELIVLAVVSGLMWN